MDEYASESDSDYTSYWRDWVSRFYACTCLFVLYASLSIRFIAMEHNIAPPVSVPTAFAGP